MNKYAQNMPFELLYVPGAQNIRDLGGYIGTGGKPVVPRRFIRGASLAGVESEGIAALRAYGVQLIVDLRSSFELERMPCPLMDDGQIVFEHVPMLDYINSSVARNDYSAFPASLEELYTGLLDNAQGSFRRIFEVFADERYTTVFFNCTAGKDRTGVTAMLLLGLAGVDADVIAEDYSWTSVLLDLPEEVRNVHVPSYLNTCKPETMLTVMRHLEERYGGAAAYLETAGVTAGQLDAIRAKLLVE